MEINLKNILGKDEAIFPALPFVRSPYNYDLKKASDAAGLDCSCDGLGRTKQSFAEEADINTLVRRFGINGQLPQGVRMPTYGDFTLVGDYQSALDAINSADASFQRMPADVRTRFGNNAAAFVDFCSDDANREEALKLGLLVPPLPVPDEPAPTRVVVVDGVIDGVGKVRVK